MKVYKVYLIREKSTGDIKYVGLTRQSLKMRFNSHMSRFKKPRKDYQIELIAEDLNNLEAASLESLLIEQYDLLNTGWNTSPGSINGFSNYHSEDQKIKWSKERKGKPVSKEHAKKNRIARLGKKNSEYHKKRISEVKSKPVLCVETGEVFKSGRQAADKLNLSRSKISNVCHGKRKSTGGYTFRFVKNYKGS